MECGLKIKTKREKINTHNNALQLTVKLRFLAVEFERNAEVTARYLNTYRRQRNAEGCDAGEGLNVSSPSGLFPEARKSQSKDCPRARTAFHGNLPLMVLNDTLYYGKAKAYAFFFGGKE